MRNVIAYLLILGCSARSTPSARDPGRDVAVVISDAALDQQDATTTDATSTPASLDVQVMPAPVVLPPKMPAVRHHRHRELGDFPTSRKHRDVGDFPACTVNPLARGCP